MTRCACSARIPTRGSVRSPLRALGDRMTHTYETLVERATSDPDPIVRATAATMPSVGGPPVTETSRTLGELDRMVVLRRVPLFSELDPEDLQRIAASAQERLYPAGEALVREGDFGDELIVIVSGPSASASATANQSASCGPTKPVTTSANWRCSGTVHARRP